MRYKLSAPATLHTTIQLPASKSISNRALILHALAQGHIAPSNLSDCDDTRVMIKALDGNPGHIDILAAGTAMRFLTAYLSVTRVHASLPVPNGCNNAPYVFWWMPYVNWVHR